MADKKKHKKISRKTIYILVFVVAILVSAAVLVGLRTSASGNCSVFLDDYSGCPTVKYGSKGITVQIAQSALNNACKSPDLTIDGIFGTKTKTRTINFQKAKGLTADGIIGPNTWSKLQRSNSNTVNCPF